MNHECRCPKCLIIITGKGYEMPSKCVKHIKEKHPEDYQRLEEAKNNLEEIKKEFDGFHFMYYY